MLVYCRRDCAKYLASLNLWQNIPHPLFKQSDNIAFLLDRKLRFNSVGKIIELWEVVGSTLILIVVVVVWSSASSIS
jgi:hypothetical protein